MRDGEQEKKIDISEAERRGQGRKPEAAQLSGSNLPGNIEETGPAQPDLIERILARGNMLKALQAVKANQGPTGVDGMEVKQLRGYLREYWAEIREQILNGSYKPQPVRRVDIPKPGGGRLAEQGLIRVLEPIFAPSFSKGGYGFRPGRGAHDALGQASEYAAEGRNIVLDLDLQKFFDRVQHAC